MSQKPSQKRTKRQKLVALLAALLALLMILPMFITALGGVASGASSKSSIQSQINALKNKNKDLASQKANLKTQLKSIQADKNEALNQKDLIEQQIDVIQDEITNLEEQITQYQALIAEKEAEVAENQAAEEKQFDLFRKQVRAMEEEGTATIWTILFSADSFSDLLDKVDTVNAIADYNDQVCDDLQAARAALQAAKAELQAAQAEAETAKAAQETAKAELKDQEAQVQTLIDQISKDEKLTKKAMDDLEAAAKANDAEIARKDKELQALIEAERQKGGTKYQFDPGTGFYWPLPIRYVSVNSFFGPRKDPFTGKRSNHSGTDIGAHSGTEIYAAHGGIVLTSTRHSSYGNYVVVSRGDGVTTLYAHMSKRAVKVGDTVQQGQVIGYAGSTGRSTAPHLHFEVRVNGVRQDALKYYPNVSWKNNTGFPYN